VLEGLAARYAAARINEAGLRRLDKLMSTMQNAAARGDERAQIAADFRFHRTIMEASGNWLLLQSWERMQLATTTFLTIARSHHSRKDIAERHARLIDALRARSERAEHDAGTSKSRASGCRRRCRRNSRSHGAAEEGA
jgi:DNA-binding GntR family transcriptional regulator